MKGDSFIPTCAPLLSVVTRTQGSRDSPRPGALDVCPCCCFRPKRIYCFSRMRWLSRYQRRLSPFSSFESYKEGNLEWTQSCQKVPYSLDLLGPTLDSSILLEYMQLSLWKMSNRKQTYIAPFLESNWRCIFGIHRGSSFNNPNIYIYASGQQNLGELFHSRTNDWALEEHSFSNNRNTKKRVLILMSDTGGGHRASAEALRAAFDDLYPGQLDTMIVDLWTQIVKGPFRNLPKQYMFLQRNPTLWKLTWFYGVFPLSRCITEEFSYWIAHERVKKAFLMYRPDIIVSVHPLCQTLPLRVLKDMGIRERIPFVTVVTDLGSAHPLWFHKDVDICFVPTSRVRDIARRCGVSIHKIRQYGLPVRPAFWKENRDKLAVRNELGLEQIPTILIVGGGDGMSGVGRIARALACRLSEEFASAQLVIICGRNTALQQELSRMRWPLPVYVKGFVNNMSEWMAASDCIVTKAGPGTIAEALIRGLPIFLYGFLPGQEAGNVPFVVENGVGFFESDPMRLANRVIQLFREQSHLVQMSVQAKNVGRPLATYQIAGDICDLLWLQRTKPPISSPLEVS
ncbi:Monogalactosyldiacylglycerol synthase 1, chloroplastic [Galdieria sulphuraria]|uniref:monogalactosyldiacylglycerol synthase n=1 Tax=Galdieria sulphuraria TaxID=130081 RepID=M2XY45_GALSU|nr:1,2-diacylglycerol 3-beta-galactosyltransferase [Galdieria sulphuraria]EME28573.1 1,2-diacylglycerol 3-beta-galactosyltransferase [Galdieria sulphuraria]GJD08531.1 Monogalactosyldiacylglycerol synthase 1, chloroplastic [Galdieria sulphuraria]|eukprot:XP_005705093.1 1,2-diacylglycerol 3-beta-galactosyltransferase [Galdieria sulphuraria]